MSEIENINVDRNDLLEFFIQHLDKIYAAKNLLISGLPEILEDAHFSDLKDGISSTIEDVEKQVARMNEIYDIMGRIPSNANVNGLKGLVEDSFKDIKLYSENQELRDMSILFYLHNIESTEMASF